MTIQEILKGCEVGNLQQVGYMTVIPLVSDIQDERFISPVKAKYSTRDYGTMEFTNETDSVLIVPLNTGYVIKRASQDHAMCSSGLVKSHERKEYNNAACIQESQGGYTPGGYYDMLILPWALREPAVQLRKELEYAKLWKAISKFNEELGLNSAGHLEYFLGRFQKELDEFVAEFEVIQKQVGAIILVNGHVFGIERSPSYAYFASIFKPLVRECYGSVAIQIANNLKLTPSNVYKTRIPLSQNVSDLDDIEEELKKANKKQVDISKKVVRELLQDEFILEPEEKVNGYEILTLSQKQLTGQVVIEGEKIIYASLFVRRGWLKNQDWYKAKQFTI